MAEKAVVEKATGARRDQRQDLAQSSQPLGAPLPSPPVSREPAKAPASERPRPRTKASPAATLGFAAAVFAVLGYAWSLRLERHITAESGLGYALGITGGLMLLTVLFYPLRKTMKSLRGIGTVPKWFRLHMVLGILGPTLIILHSNFRLSAINSAIAMFSMLTVVASGLVGRFLYSRVHVGLYGQKAELTALRADAEAFRQSFGADIEHAPGLEGKLKAAEDALFARSRGLLSTFAMLFRLRASRKREHDAFLEEAQALLSAAALRERWDRETFDWRLDAARDHLEAYQACLAKAAGFRLYERLFSLWHHLHMPLYFLLIVTAIIHVITVHLY